MNCEELSSYVVDYLDETLDPGTHAKLEAHLETCDACREAVAVERQAWLDLQSMLQQQAPSPRLRERFYTMLDGHAAAHERRPGKDSGAWDAWAAWLRRFHIPRMVPQAVAAGFLLAGGILIGTQITDNASTDAGVDGLRADVRSLSQLVTLSLLQQESASDRLKGVHFGSIAAVDHDDVLLALIDAVGHDPSVNVRLAAIDALQPHVARRAVQSSLLAYLRSETSPLVQVSLVDVLMEADGHGTRTVLEGFATDESVDESVRAHLLARLEESA